MGRRSRKFESYISDQFRGYGATVAQMLCKHKVRSSNLLNSTNLISRSSNGKTIDSKPINVGSIPTRDASFYAGDGIGIHTSRKGWVMGVRVPPRAPIL